MKEYKLNRETIMVVSPVLGKNRKICIIKNFKEREKLCDNLYIVRIYLNDIQIGTMGFGVFYNVVKIEVEGGIADVYIDNCELGCKD